MSKIHAAFVGVALTILASTAHALEWKEISADEAKLHFSAIEPAKTGFRTAWSASWKSRYEIGEWVSPLGGYPQALLVLRELASHVKFPDRYDFKKVLKNSIKLLKDVKLGDSTTYKGVTYWRFRKLDAECIALGKMFGETDWGNWRGPGNKVFYGYYCDRQIDDVEPILDAISVSD